MDNPSPSDHLGDNIDQEVSFFKDILTSLQDDTQKLDVTKIVQIGALLHDLADGIIDTLMTETSPIDSNEVEYNHTTGITQHEISNTSQRQTETVSTTKIDKNTTQSKSNKDPDELHNVFVIVKRPPAGRPIKVDVTVTQNG